MTSVTGMQKLPNDDVPNTVVIEFEPTNTITSADDEWGGGLIVNAPAGFEFTGEANLTDDVGHQFKLDMTFESPNVLIMTLRNLTGVPGDGGLQQFQSGTMYRLTLTVFNSPYPMETQRWFLESFFKLGKDVQHVDEY